MKNSKSKVVGIREQPLPVNADLVEALKKLVTEAESGRLRAIVYFADFLTYNQSQAVGGWERKDALYAFELWKHRMLHGLQNENGILET